MNARKPDRTVMVWHELTQLGILVLAVACSKNEPSSALDPKDASHVPYDAIGWDVAVTDAGSSTDAGASTADSGDASDGDGGEVCSLPPGVAGPFAFHSSLINCVQGETAQVAGVFATRLKLIRTSDGAPIDFHWIGPDLTGRFQVGESVQFQARTGNVWAEEPCAAGWSLVVGASHVAAAWNGYGEFSIPAPGIPPLPYGGPAIARTFHCQFETEIPCVRSFGVPVTRVYSLEVGPPGSAVVAKPGMTVTIDGWEVTNVQSGQHDSWDCGFEASEDGDYDIVTALGPTTDA